MRTFILCLLGLLVFYLLFGGIPAFLFSGLFISPFLSFVLFVFFPICIFLYIVFYITIGIWNQRQHAQGYTFLGVSYIVWILLCIGLVFCTTLFYLNDKM